MHDATGQQIGSDVKVTRYSQDSFGNPKRSRRTKPMSTARHAPPADRAVGGLYGASPASTPVISGSVAVDTVED
jgi:hypothetical protein